MSKTYKEWINKHYSTPEKALGKCREAVTKMRKIFPELGEVLGYVTTGDGEEHPHCWCVDFETGEFVDPTVKQFPIPFTYTILPDNHPRVIHKKRKCMNCGEAYYSDKTPFCGIKCENDFIEWQG